LIPLLGDAEDLPEVACPEEPENGKATQKDRSQQNHPVLGDYQAW